MRFGLARLVLYGLVFVAVSAALLWFAVERKQLPEPCLAGNTAMEAGDYSQAIDQYLLCIESGELEDDLLASVYFVLGDAYSAKGNPYQAVEDYGTAIELAPGHAWAYNNRCWTYGLLRRPEDALRDCNEALRLLPNTPQILDSRALAYWQLGELDKARRDLERARQIDATLPMPDARLEEFEALF